MNEFKLPDCKHTPKPFPYGTAVMLEPRVPTCSFCESEAKDAEIEQLTAEVRALRKVAAAATKYVEEGWCGYEGGGTSTHEGLRSAVAALSAKGG